MTINNLSELRVTVNPVTGEILELVTTCKEVVTTSEGTGQSIKRCQDIIKADKNILFVADNKIIGRCDSKGDNYSACKVCVDVLNKSAASTEQLTSTKYSFDDNVHHDDWSF